MNAFDIENLRLLYEHVERLSNNDKLKVVIFTGNGKAFSASRGSVRQTHIDEKKLDSCKSELMIEN